MEKNINSANFCLNFIFCFCLFSCSTKAPLDMGLQVQQISVKNQTTKMGKSSTKNKNDTNKSIEFSVKTFFDLVFTITWQRKKHEIYVKPFVFSPKINKKM